MERDAPPTLTLLVVRHGLTDWNAEGRLQGQSDIPLATRGREQAVALGNRLAAAWDRAPTLLPGPADAVYTSDLSRARETAEILVGTIRTRLPKYDPRLTVSTLLRERHFGVWEGLTLEEGRVRFGSERSHRDEGESQTAVHARMEAALNMVKADSPTSAVDRVVLVVGHGGSLRQLVCVTNGFDVEAARHFTYDNTGLSVLALTSHGSTIRLWNDTSHLNGGSEA